MHKLPIIAIVISFVYKTTTTNLEQCVKKATALSNTRTTYSVLQSKPLELQDCLVLCCTQEKCLSVNFYSKKNKESNCSLVYFRSLICFERKDGWSHYIIRRSNQSISFVNSTPKNAHLCSETLSRRRKTFKKVI
ncbi:unnamed protein product [Schistosoma turkestanicum]|nr:unnamed protein product [Schistosoma turkestanicum]